MKAKTKTPLVWRMNNRKEKEELLMASAIRCVARGYASPVMAMQEVRELKLIPQRRKDRLFRKLSVLPNRYKQ